MIVYAACHLTHANPYLAAFAAGSTLATLDKVTAENFECPASSSWQDFLGFECRGGGVGQAQVHLLGPVP